MVTSPQDPYGQQQFQQYPQYPPPGWQMPTQRQGEPLASPASFVVFDLLALNHRDVRPRPYRARRALLEDLLGRQLPHGLVLMPATTDPAVARAWLTNHSAVLAHVQYSGAAVFLPGASSLDEDLS